tara:strand:- start:41 stop:226 length:186 start_codon:yes stop_codon:yes gene_type:complete
MGRIYSSILVLKTEKIKKRKTLEINNNRSSLPKFRNILAFLLKFREIIHHHGSVRPIIKGI